MYNPFFFGQYAVLDAIEPNMRVRKSRNNNMYMAEQRADANFFIISKLLLFTSALSYPLRAFSPYTSSRFVRTHRYRHNCVVHAYTNIVQLENNRVRINNITVYSINHFIHINIYDSFISEQ